MHDAHSQGPLLLRIPVLPYYIHVYREGTHHYFKYIIEEFSSYVVYYGKYLL